MADANLEIRGDEALLELLNKLDDSLPRSPEIRDMSHEIMHYMVGVMREYPPPKPSYQRTFNLKNSWQAVVGPSADIFFTVFSTGIDYNRLVMDAEEQAWMHVGYWETAQARAVRTEEDVESAYDRALQTMINRYK